ncbi:MAG: YebC/PmpR family DNA-binding transcriptional regulator [Candidatus Marinimicrobia bacterium]|nr:YebC/PmpR family DNA-binding transcriptional regulator [Candidatus Neomarinimicrobiota bacterium]
MSGHSKWATIKRKKAVTDQKRGKIFTKLIKEIMVAARAGGGDEDANPRLRQAVMAARGANMPQDNIKRAIKKGTGELPGQNFEEATYEGYGPAGVAIIMEVLTDNKKRTVAEIRHLMTKYGGNLGENGSVAWMFDRKGIISLKKDSGDEDSLFEAALEAGAEDFNSDEEEFYIVTTGPTDLMSVRDSLEAQNCTVESSDLEMIPKNLTKVEGSAIETLMTLMELLEDHDDIKSVFSNFDIDEDLISQD